MGLRKRRMSTLLAVSATAMVIAGGVGPPAGASERAEAAAGQDGGQSDALISLVEADRTTFGGISFDEKTGTATIRYDDDAGDRVARSKLGQRTGAGAWRVVLQPVRYSLAELDVVRQEVATDPEWRAVAGKLISKWYIDNPRNRVAVGVTELTPEVTQAATRLFGDRVSLHVAARPDRHSRVDDFEPWAAGTRITSGSSCSSGYIIRTTTTPVQRRMVSAGHCFALGATVRNNGDTVGTVVTRQLVERGRDFEFIGGRTYQPFMYTGGPGSLGGQAIKGSKLSGVGLGVCTNGATSGQNCAGVVIAIDICVTFSDGVTTCVLDEAESTDGSQMSRAGDSGGPVIAFDSAGLKVVGSIVGGAQTVLFHSYHHIVPSGWTVDSM
jgi:hypothetical protein